jgi:hypothetical protein
MNDAYIDIYNPTFKILQELDSSRHTLYKTEDTPAKQTFITAKHDIIRGNTHHHRVSTYTCIP